MDTLCCLQPLLATTHVDPFIPVRRAQFGRNPKASTSTLRLVGYLIDWQKQGADRVEFMAGWIQHGGRRSL